MPGWFDVGNTPTNQGKNIAVESDCQTAVMIAFQSFQGRKGGDALTKSIGKECNVCISWICLCMHTEKEVNKEIWQRESRSKMKMWIFGQRLLKST